MAQQADLILLGGGASGMMAAVTAGEILRKAGYQGKILLLEGASKAGRKLLATGNGRCNLSNLSIGEAFYRGDVEWASPVLRQFPAKTVIRRFEKLGLLCRSDSEGRVYPYNLQASAVLEILRLHLASLETEILTNIFLKTTSIMSRNG